MTKVLIKKVSNGYVMRYESEEDGGTRTFVYQELIDLIIDIPDFFEEYDSRYAKKRLYITEHPGDKHEDFYTTPCPICGRSDEEGE
jgi:hypothetical protein